MYSKILNPITGVLYKLDSDQGKYTLQRYLLQTGGASSLVKMVCGSKCSKSCSPDDDDDDDCSTDLIPGGYSNVTESYHHIRETVNGRHTAGRRNNSDQFKKVCELPTLEKSPYIQNITSKQKNTARLQFSVEFTIVKGFDVLNYDGIDQGTEGACSFVGFLNLTNISKKKLKRSGIATKGGWERAWHELVTNGYIDLDVGGAADIAQTLDAMKSSDMLDTSKIVYIPIRSANRREIYFNEDFWVDAELLCDMYGVNMLQYNASPWMFQNAYLIETLINMGKPIEINALVHSRTCVGYNDNQLIFADNWGNNGEVDKKSLEPFEVANNVNFIAGFSVINKWAIYAWMRDCVYYK